MKKSAINKGFTLIEVIIAFAILAIVLVSFLGMFSNGLRTIFYSGDRTEANNYAQTIMDTIYHEVDVDNLEASIVNIMDSEVGTGKYVDYTVDYVDFDVDDTGFDNSLAADSDIVVKYYVQKKDLIISKNTDNAYEIILKVYYGDKSRFVILTSPLL
ncbi:type IV pilus modification PilV family protein [Gudongella sp. SC589]|uniref:type IV pilus modification PilV family protein n=1 Tax=Gudongella sp. SC589 TaxID=3385990 RepID=UPI0039049B5A